MNPTCSGSQRIFYKALIRNGTYESVEPRTSTKLRSRPPNSLSKPLNGSTPANAKVRKVFRNTDFPKNTRNFLWNILHAGFKIRDPWVSLNKEYNMILVWGTCYYIAIRSRNKETTLPSQLSRWRKLTSDLRTLYIDDSLSAPCVVRGKYSVILNSPVST